MGPTPIAVPDPAIRSRVPAHAGAGATPSPPDPPAPAARLQPRFRSGGEGSLAKGVGGGISFRGAAPTGRHPGGRREPGLDIAGESLAARMRYYWVLGSSPRMTGGRRDETGGAVVSLPLVGRDQGWGSGGPWTPSVGRPPPQLCYGPDGPSGATLPAKGEGGLTAGFGGNRVGWTARSVRGAPPTRSRDGVGKGQLRLDFPSPRRGREG